MAASNASPHAAQVRELLAIEQMRVREFGYHGTSVQAVAHLAQTGSMPVAGTSGPEFYVFTAVRDGKFQHAETAREAAEYADDQLAWLHAAAEHFESDLQTVQHSITEYTPEELEELGLKSLVPYEDVCSFRKTHQRAGWRDVVIAIASIELMNFGLPHGWKMKDEGPGEAVFSHPLGRRSPGSAVSLHARRRTALSSRTCSPFEVLAEPRDGDVAAGTIPSGAHGRVRPHA